MLLQYKDKYDLNWLGLDIDQVIEFLRNHDSFNPLDGQLEIELENKGLREIALMYDPDYIWYTAKLLLNITLHPIQCVILESFMKYSFPMLCMFRGGSKSLMMAVYSLIRAALFPGSKIILTGAAFRQSKFIFEYIESIYNHSPLLKSIFKGQKPVSRLPDFWTFYLGESKIIATPTGDGNKIRGLRGNIIICDEFNSISTEVYEIVINQFAVVSSNPIENIQAKARREALAKDGKKEKEVKPLSYVANQSIISGTIRYDFEPMAMYWRKYKNIIESRGESLTEQFGEIGKQLNWRDFCIIRIPYDLMPAGFLDEKTVARSKSVMNSDFFAAEFGCVPITDSSGFFKRSLIESCTAKLNNISSDGWPSWCPHRFDARIRGNPNSIHVMGIDPAYNQDNFAIVILECFPEHARVVYAWSTSKRTFQTSGEVTEKNYFSFCTRKIRDLLKLFPCVGIAIDSQGGGYTIIESLGDSKQLQAGELPIWPVIESEKPRATDSYAGEHIIHIISFSDGSWTQAANYGLKKAMEDKTLLFPEFNSILLGLASEKDKEDLINHRILDSLEDCMLEIEELKDELTLIIRSTTSSTGREKWDTPEIKMGRYKKERLRNDRYAALLMANYLAKTLQQNNMSQNWSYDTVGAVVGKNEGYTNNKMYIGPSWYEVGADLFRGIVR